MWPFKKKIPKSSLTLPPLPGLPDKEETVSLDEENVPEELPALETKPKPALKPRPSATEQHFPMLPEHEELSATEQTKPVSSHTFINSAKYKKIMGEINNTNIDFDNIDFGVGRAVDIKNNKDSTIEKLQHNLEEVGEKLMSMEDTLFGG